jgi:aerobic C4-dicarboxylate transport protein
VSRYTGAAQEGGVAGILAHVVPASAVDAFARGDVLQIVFVALLFGVGLAPWGSAATASRAGSGACRSSCSAWWPS